MASSSGTADSFAVKLEITVEDSLDDEFGPVNKRSRLSPSTSSSVQVYFILFFI